jgi:hypothetical protein
LVAVSGVCDRGRVCWLLAYGAVVGFGAEEAVEEENRRFASIGIGLALVRDVKIVGEIDRTDFSRCGRAQWANKKFSYRIGTQDFATRAK